MVVGDGDGHPLPPSRLDFAAAAYPLPSLSLPPSLALSLSPPLIRRRFLSVLVCGMDGGGGVVFVWLDDDGAGVGVQSHHIEYL